MRDSRQAAKNPSTPRAAAIRTPTAKPTTTGRPPRVRVAVTAALEAAAARAVMRPLITMPGTIAGRAEDPVARAALRTLTRQAAGLAPLVLTTSLERATT